MTAVATPDTCLVCGSDRTRSPLGGLLRQCRDCTFTWTSEAVPATEDLYDASYFAGGGYENYYQPAARRYEAGVRVRWLLSHCRPTTLLEAGCAAGFFVEAAAGAGIAALGIEISAGPARYAREQLGVPVRHGTLESAHFDARFDAVCAFHVLEHVDDPRRFLAAARFALEPGGVLVLEVPNVGSVSARRLGAAWPHLQPEYHRWHFTSQSLARLVTEVGFQVVHQETAVFRVYMPPRFRRRQGRRHVAADLRDLQSLRLIHTDGAELLRLVARRPVNDHPVNNGPTSHRPTTDGPTTDGTTTDGTTTRRPTAPEGVA